MRTWNDLSSQRDWDSFYEAWERNDEKAIKDGLREPLGVTPKVLSDAEKMAAHKACLKRERERLNHAITVGLKARGLRP